MVVGLVIITLKAQGDVKLGFRAASLFLKSRRRLSGLCYELSEVPLQLLRWSHLSQWWLGAYTTNRDDTHNSS